MSRRKKLFYVVVFITIITDAMFYLYIPMTLWWIINIVAFIFVMLAVLTLIANALIKKTTWYKELFVDYEHEIFPDNNWYRKHDERNYDIVALGSSSAKYAYDFTATGIKGMNWAQQPQSLIDDFKLLKTFHSILHKKGIVLINIMPFSSCNKKNGLMDTFKYIGTYFDKKYFDQRYYEKAFLCQRFPILFRKPAVKALIQYIKKSEFSSKLFPDKQLMSEEQLQKDALSYVSGWKKQFGIIDFDAPLTDENVHGRNIRLQIMREMIDFIIERDYVPVYVITPVTTYLSEYFTTTFKETYIYSFLREVGRDVQILDYSNDKDLSVEGLYFNSFFMNRKGTAKFTDIVLSDLGLKNRNNENRNCNSTSHK